MKFYEVDPKVGFSPYEAYVNGYTIVLNRTDKIKQYFNKKNYAQELMGMPDIVCDQWEVIPKEDTTIVVKLTFLEAVEAFNAGESPWCSDTDMRRWGKNKITIPDILPDDPITMRILNSIWWVERDDGLGGGTCR